MTTQVTGLYVNRRDSSIVQIWDALKLVGISKCLVSFNSYTETASIIAVGKPIAGKSGD